MEGITSQRSDGVERPSGRLLTALVAPGLPGWLLALVLGCATYAVFANGATAIPAESRAQIGIAAGVLLAGLGLASGKLGAARSPLAWCAVAALAIFALFSALSVTWSADPGQSWLAANRAAEYAAVVAIVLVAAPSLRRAPELGLAGLSVLGLVVALYALGGKLFPTLSAGPINLDHASQFARLRAPLGYWNALGLLLVMAMPGLLWIIGDRSRAGPLRVAALLALELLVVATALTLSRGAVIAFAAMLAVTLGVGPNRLSTLGATLLTTLAAVPVVAYDFSSGALSGDGIPAAHRAGDGALLGVLLAIAMLALAWVGRRVLVDESSRLGRGWELLGAAAERARRPAAVIAVLAAAAVALFASGWASRQWNDFRKPVGVSNQPGRLISASSSNRWIWWSEAAGAFSDRPIAGWGAGSFPILHDRYRHYATQVRSAHSVPLQFLAEGGLVGAALGLGGLALLGAAGVSALRRSEGAERAVRAALLAAAAAWAIHCLYDWDWEIPGVTVPALAAAALAAAPLGSGRRWIDQRPRRGQRRSLIRPALGVPVAIATALLSVSLAVSAALPALAMSDRVDAQIEAADAGGDRARLEDAASRALLAQKLDPFDEEALFAAADLESRLGRLGTAQDLLFQAARLQPGDYRVWDKIIIFEVAVGNARLGRMAVEKRIAAEPLTFTLDPPISAGNVFAASLPAQLSPTAFGTPP